MPGKKTLKERVLSVTATERSLVGLEIRGEWPHMMAVDS